jgi:hypothetical protein
MFGRSIAEHRSAFHSQETKSVLPVLPVFVSSISHQLPVLLAVLEDVNSNFTTPLTFVILGASFFALAAVLRRVKEPSGEHHQAPASADVQTVHRVRVDGSHARKLAHEPVKVSD